MSTIVPGGPQPEDAIPEAAAGAFSTTFSYRKGGAATGRASRPVRLI